MLSDALRLGAGSCADAGTEDRLPCEPQGTPVVCLPRLLLLRLSVTALPGLWDDVQWDGYDPALPLSCGGDLDHGLGLQAAPFALHYPGYYPRAIGGSSAFAQGGWGLFVGFAGRDPLGPSLGALLCRLPRDDE